MINRIFYIFFKSMSYIPLPVGRFIGRILGTLFLLAPSRRKEVSIDNIRESFGDSMGRKEIKRLNRKVVFHFAQMIFEVPHVLRMNMGNLERYITFGHEENLYKALKKGKGAFILTGHFGNWEMMSTAASLYFGNLAVVARPFDFQPLDRFMNDLRSMFGAEIIPKQKGMRRLLNANKREMVIGILLDQNVDWYEGVFVNFLGRRACANKGLALLALRTGTPVIPAFPVRQKNGRYHVSLGDEVQLIRTGDKTKDIEENTALFTGIIEDYIRRYPDHWFWFHMRWKTRPYCRLPDGFYRKQGASISGT
ncbi:lysophospholipid acyltransferase family protein [Thermodesulfobacteriota bacterium]